MKPRAVAASLFLLGVLVGLSAAGAPLAAQDGRVTGTVRGEDGRALANATVQVVGTEIGTLTGADGTFDLSVPAGQQRIRATLIGFRQAERTVTVESGRTVRLELVLRSQALQLDDLVVSVAAGQTRRRELGTDLVTVDAEEAARNSGARNLSDLLSGRSTGLSITESAGGAGTASRIRIRGSTSITQDNTPIIYVDGARVSNATGSGPGSFDFPNGQTVSRLDDIDPNDIASVQVVKGPTAATLYGSEAAAGVLLIETKRGSADGAGVQEVRYSTTQGFNVDTEDYWDNFASLAPFGVTDATDPEIQQFRPIENPVTGEVFMRNNPLKNDLTDPFRTARTAEHRASVRGGSEGFGYYASGRYELEEGTLPNNRLDRVALRGNFQLQAAENLDVSVSTNFIEMDVRLPDNDRSAVGMITNGGAGLPLFSFGTTADGRRGDCAITFFAGQPESLCDGREGNLTARFDKLTTITNEQEVDRFLGSSNVNWRPLPWLDGRLTVGVDFIGTRDLNLVPLDPDRPFGSDSDGFVQESQVDERKFTFDAATTGSWDLGDRWTFSSSVGTQVFRTETEGVACQGEGGFASPSADSCDAALTFTGASDLVEEFEVGGFFQQQVSYGDYLFGTGAVRLDDNSSLGDDEDLIVSPSANVSAVLTSMPFWNLDFVNNLRLRFAWGQAAQAPDPFAEARTFLPIRVSQGGSQQIGIRPGDPGNPDLGAEEVEEFEFGADLELMNGRFAIQATYFDSETTDAILPTNVAPSTGFTGTQFVNIGKVENEGFEIALDATAWESRNVIWDVGFQHSTTDPVISDMAGEPPITFGLGTNQQMFREGFSPGHFFGRVVQSAERDAAGNIVPGSIELAPGNVNDPNRPFDRALGKASPGNFQSISTTITLFDRFRFFSLFDRSSDFVKLDNSQNFRSPFIPGTTTSGEFALRQATSTPEGQAAMEFSEFTRNALFTQDASFIKWREATINYRLPSAVASLFGPLSGASVTIGARNLVTFTDFDGLDPELSFDGGRDSFNQAEFFSQPPSKRFFATVDLVF